MAKSDDSDPMELHGPRIRIQRPQKHIVNIVSQKLFFLWGCVIFHRQFFTDLYNSKYYLKHLVTIYMVD